MHVGRVAAARARAPVARLERPAAGAVDGLAVLVEPQLGQVLSFLVGLPIITRS